MPSFSSTRSGRRSLRSPGLPSRVGQEFRHQEQRDAAAARRRVRGARQHHVDDVVGQVVVAIGDEDLLAADPVMLAPALVARRHGAGAQGAEIRAGLRLGQVHRAGPLAGDQLPQIELLLFRRAVRLQQLDRAEIQAAGRTPSSCRPSSTSRRPRSRATPADPGRHDRGRIAAPSIRPRHSADRPRGTRAGCARRRFRARCRSGRPAGSADRVRRRRSARPRRGSRRRHRARPRPPAAPACRARSAFLRAGAA